MVFLFPNKMVLECCFFKMRVPMENNVVLKIFVEMFTSIEMNWLAWLSYFPSIFHNLAAHLCCMETRSIRRCDDTIYIESTLYRYFAPNLTHNSFRSNNYIADNTDKRTPSAHGKSFFYSFATLAYLFM